MVEFDLEKELRILLKGTTKLVQKTAMLCVETVDDYDYIKDKLFTARDAFFAVTDLRDRKLPNRRHEYGYNSFEAEYAKMPAMAIRKLFLYPVSQEYIDRIKDVVPATLSLKDLYDNHCDSPTKPIRHLLP